jgi:AraC-like DNA-binding protein
VLENPFCLLELYWQFIIANVDKNGARSRNYEIRYSLGMSDLQTPENSIATFERLHGVRITLHDIAGTITPFLRPERFSHVHPLCQAVKVQHSHRCINFGIHDLRNNILNYADGRIQVCFAGFVEVALPVFHNRALEWVLFAGPWMPGKKLQHAVRDSQPRLSSRPWNADATLPSEIDDDRAALMLEALRQLAARLLSWRQEIGRGPVTSSDIATKRQKINDLTSRRIFITRYIHEHHARPIRLSDLAEALHLSQTRCGHLVSQLCNATFNSLLLDARMRTASGMLRHTNLPISEVVMRSGFSDVSHFHKYFKKRFGVSPLKYRKRAEISQG